MSNEMYKRKEKMCPKSKNQIQMVEVNQEVAFDSDYQRHCWFNSLAQHRLPLEGRECVIRRGAASEGHSSVICKVALESLEGSCQCKDSRIFHNPEGEDGS